MMGLIAFLLFIIVLSIPAAAELLGQIIAGMFMICLGLAGLLLLAWFAGLAV